MMKRTVLILSIALSASIQLIAQSSESANGTLSHPAENTLLWHQTAAEYKALCLQAYNAAENSILDLLVENTRTKPLAIVMDLDETVLDNSPYSVKMMRQGESYTESSWEEWVNLESAELVPGAKEFIEFATTKQIEVFYISNRSHTSLQATYNNLIKQGINTKTENLLLKAENTKEERREELKDYAIIMLIGDNLADLSADFEKKLSLEERDNLVMEEHRADFGNRYIVLPNNLYGDWMGALKRAAEDREDQLKLLKSY